MLKSIQARLRLLFLSFAALMLLSVGTMYSELGRQRQDAVVLNVAGRQRMLVQQMTLLGVESLDSRNPDTSAALENTRGLFEASLNVLKNGGAAPEIPGPASVLPAAANPAALGQIEKINLAWAEYRAAQDYLLGLPASSPRLGPARLALEAKSAALLEQSNALVLLYQGESVSRVTRLGNVEIVFFICALLLLAAAAWETSRSVLRPIGALSEAAKRIGGNHLDTPILLDAPQELADLAGALNDMQARLRSSRAELIELTDDLEQRVSQRTRELEALNEVSREISSRLNVQQVLNSVTEKARSLLNAEVASLCLLDGTGEQLNLRAVSGPQGAVLGESAPARDHFADSILAGRRNVIGGHCVGGCQMLAAEYRSSHLAAPLKVGDQVMGALCVGASRPGSFPAEATGILIKLANTAAIALGNARLFAQAERIATLEERNRIAAEMHDGLGQTLSYLGLMTDQVIEFLSEGRDTVALDRLLSTRETIEKAVSEARRAIDSLVAEPSPSRDLKESLDTVVADLSAEHNLPVLWEPEVQGAVTCLPEVAEQVLNITREAVRNAAHHAHASRILVRMGETGDCSFVSVEDDGQGFDPARSNPAGHFGLQIMHARAARIGGQVEIGSEPGQGTRVTLTWPKGQA